MATLCLHRFFPRVIDIFSNSFVLKHPKILNSTVKKCQGRNYCGIKSNTRIFSHNDSIIKVCGQGLKFSTRSENPLKKTVLYDFHVREKGKMVPFAGYEMPVSYGAQGIGASHIHTRENLSIFDVSHMLQMNVIGKGCVDFFESLVVADVKGLQKSQGTLTLYTNQNGGIIDDLIVTKIEDDFLYVVSNAACADKDLSHVKKALTTFQTNIGEPLSIEVINDHALIAVQGPKLAAVLQPLVDFDMSKLYFMNTVVSSVCGVKNCRITRCGYTGEDGVELSIPLKETQHIVETLLKNDPVKLAGLGARDTLRLEAGLCLYGNDINDETTPIEAGLAWTIGKRRRVEGGFPGAEIILAQLKNKPTKRRVGFISTGAPARAHTPILNSEGKKIGEVTSGCPSPSLKKNVAMGYVDSEYSKNGTKVHFDIRKKLVEAEVAKMPFVPAKYYLGK